MVVFPEMLPDFPSPGECQRVGAIKDLVIRNLQVTQGYSEIARAFARRVPGRVNWSGFATWASKQAGNAIRSEDLLRLALRDFGGPAALPAGKLLAFEQVRDALAKLGPFRRASEFVSAGNIKVFVEIGADLSRFVQRFAEGPEGLEEFCEGLKPGPPPEGQDLLKQAFRHYHKAWFAFDAQERDERLLFGNLLVGVHEQTRLQPEIAAALDAAFAHLHAAKDDVLAVLLPGSWLRLRHRAARLLAGLVGHRLLVDRIVERIVDTARRQVRQVITQAFMTLQVHDEVLPLAADLRAAFAPSLQHVIRPDLRALLARIDPSADSMVGSGAQDWADLADRMHFIADFFRAYHEHQDLFAAPFTKEQVDALIAGRWPAGRL